MASGSLQARGLTVLGPLAIPGSSPTVGARPSLAGPLRIGIFFFLIANLGRIPILFVGNKDAPILASDVAVLGVAGLAGWLATRHRSLRLDAVAIAALLFAGIGGASAILAMPRFGLTPLQLAVSLAYLARWLVYFSLYLAIINFVRKEDAGRVWNALEAMILTFAGFGIFQSLFLPGFAQIVDPGSELYLDWDPQGHRLVSTFLDPNLAGGLIMMGLLVMFGWLAMGERVANWKVLVLLAALLLTVSRSALLGLIAGGLLIMAVRGLSRRLLKAAALAVLAVLPFTPLLIDFARDYGKFTLGGSALARLVMWGRALEILVDNPLIGIGFNTYGFVQTAYGYEAVGRASFTLDGGVLFAAVMTGLIGAAVYCWMVARTLRRCRRIWRDHARMAFDRGLALGIAAATVALLVHSIFLNSLFYPFLMGPLWILWGLAFLLRSRGIGVHEVRVRSPGLVAIGTGMGRGWR